MPDDALKKVGMELFEGAEDLPEIILVVGPDTSKKS